MNIIETEWKETAQALKSEINNGKLNLGEVGYMDFVRWFTWRTKTASSIEQTPLYKFDILSILSFFEEDVIKENKP